ncbi:pre-rRNA-processing protein pno1 [Tulasnella sp. 418]|nr:pre-rRNA-processing protein pno1 [Tulasnella sp. 418]
MAPVSTSNIVNTKKKRRGGVSVSAKARAKSAKESIVGPSNPSKVHVPSQEEAVPLDARDDEEDDVMIDPLVAGETVISHTDIILTDSDPSADNNDRPNFAPLSASAQKTTTATETRRIPIPPHRMTPLKKDWVNIFSPLTEMVGLQVRMNVHRRAVELRTSRHTKEVGAIQKGADFVRAYALGFDIQDAIALLRLDDLYLDSFEIKDVKTLQGEHLSRAIGAPLFVGKSSFSYNYSETGRIAGQDGKTKFTIENASRTRIILADTKIHILGSFQNIKIARDAIVSLILGSPPGKIYASLRTIGARLKQRAI